jgi:hypothetical protein
LPLRRSRHRNSPIGAVEIASYCPNVMGSILPVRLKTAEIRNHCLFPLLSWCLGDRNVT